MIDIQGFLSARGAELFGVSGLCRESPTEEFIEFFLKNHAALDGEHLRCAILIISSVNRTDVRSLVKGYYNHPDVGVGHAVGVFFHRQVEQGYIERMTWQEWTAVNRN